MCLRLWDAHISTSIIRRHLFKKLFICNTSYKSITMKKIFFLLLFAASGLTFGQTYKYDVKAMGINAGTLSVTRKTGNGTEQYVLETHSSINYLLGKIEVDHITRCTYKNGVLQNSYVRNDKNGEVEYYTSADYDGSVYQITTEKGKKTLSGPITFAICHLFFDGEPTGKTQIYSDRYGQYVPLKKVEDHVYRIDFPDKDYIIYHYESGKIVKADIPSPVGKAHLYLQQ